MTSVVLLGLSREERGITVCGHGLGKNSFNLFLLIFKIIKIPFNLFTPLYPVTCCDILDL